MVDPAQGGFHGPGPEGKGLESRRKFQINMCIRDIISRHPGSDGDVACKFPRRLRKRESAARKMKQTDGRTVLFNDDAGNGFDSSDFL